MPDEYKMVCWRGATFRQHFVLYDGTVDDGPRDLTGYTAKLTIRNKPGGTVLQALTTENDGILLGDADGTIDLYISDEDTAAFTWRTGVYDLLLTSSSGTDPLLYGPFAVKGV
jgi:hypothetical protein